MALSADDPSSASISWRRASITESSKTFEALLSVPLALDDGSTELPNVEMSLSSKSMPNSLPNSERRSPLSSS